MPRLALINMVIGFAVIFLSAALGTIIVDTITEQFVTAPQLLSSWRNTIVRSAHGHTSLFGVIHILFALTLPYSRLSSRFKFWQSLGLAAGTVAMGPVLLVKSLVAPTLETDFLSFFLGVLLSLFLFAIIFHAFGIFLGIKKTS